ncbi:MAG: hypothetical protein Phyf2KO_06340 [Phycisphaerales bacterium]
MLRHPVLYPNLVKALVFLAAMDVMLTHIILQLGGFEANPIAAHVIERGGTLAMSLYKFSLITVFVLIMQYIGIKHADSGRRLASAGVLISMLPIAVGLMTLPTLVSYYFSESESAADGDAARPEQSLEAVPEDEVVLWEFEA